MDSSMLAFPFLFSFLSKTNSLNYFRLVTSLQPFLFHLHSVNIWCKYLPSSMRSRAISEQTVLHTYLWSEALTCSLLFFAQQPCQSTIFSIYRQFCWCVMKMTSKCNNFWGVEKSIWPSMYWNTDWCLFILISITGVWPPSLRFFSLSLELN